MKISTKSPAEKEQEEVERLVRKSPTKKPPRTDKTRQRIEVKDQDLETEDKDLSLNYKVIGGSELTRLAKVVAKRYAQTHRYAQVQEDDPRFIEWLNKVVDNPETGREVKIKTLRKAPEGTAARDRYEDMYKSWSEKVEDSESKPKQNKEQDKPKPKDKPSPKSQDKPLDMDHVEELSVGQIYDAMLSADKEQKKILDKVLQEKKAPIPKGFMAREDFTGKMTPDMASVLEQQILNWDIHDFNDNMMELMDNQIQAELSGNERDADYFRRVRNEYDRLKGSLRAGNKPMPDVVKAALEAIDDPDREFQKEDQYALAAKAKEWFQQGMFSSYNEVISALDRVDSELEDSKEGTVKHTYLTTLKEKLDKVQGRKVLDSTTTSGRFLTRVKELSDGPLADVDPNDYDLTDPNQIEEFVQRLSKLSDDAIIELVKEEPQYMIHFSFDPDDRGEKSFSRDEKSSFLMAVEKDLQMRGFLEQLDFTGEDIITTEEFEKDRANFEKFLSTKKPDFVKGSWWDRFMEWIKDKQREGLGIRKSSYRRGLVARQVSKKYFPLR